MSKTSDKSINVHAHGFANCMDMELLLYLENRYWSPIHQVSPIYLDMRVDLLLYSAFCKFFKISQLSLCNNVFIVLFTPQSEGSTHLQIYAHSFQRCVLNWEYRFIHGPFFSQLTTRALVATLPLHSNSKVALFTPGTRWLAWWPEQWSWRNEEISLKKSGWKQTDDTEEK